MKTAFWCASLLAIASPAAASSTGTFVSVAPQTLASLDPAAIYEEHDLAIALNIYEPLLAHGPNSWTFEPFLATAVPTRENGLLSADGRTYSFPIRKGVLFHDGSELIPEDVRYSLLRVMLSDFSQTGGQPAAMFLNAVFGVTALSDARGRPRISYAQAAKAVRVEGDRLVVRLRRPNDTFLGIISSWPFIMSKKWAVAMGEWDGEEASWSRFRGRPAEASKLRFVADGTGPFRLEGREASKNVVVLARHEGYWRGPAALKRLVFHEVASEMLRLSMLESGDADCAQLSRASLRDAANIPGVKVYDGLPGWTVGHIIVFNFKSDNTAALRSGRLDGKGVPSGFFADRDVRLGFAYAFDYEAFFKQALRGQGHRASGPLPFHIYNRRDPEVPFSYDPAQAAEHFKKAWGGRLWKKGFSTVIGYPAGSPEAHAAAEILASGLKAINPAFRLDLQPRRFAPNQKGAQEDLPVTVQTYVGDYPDPDTFAFNLLHSAGPLPRAQKYSSRKMDRLVEAARAGTPDQREALYRKVHDLYVKDVPQVELYYPQSFQAVRANVTGVGGGEWQGAFSLHNALEFYKVKKL